MYQDVRHIVASFLNGVNGFTVESISSFSLLIWLHIQQELLWPTDKFVLFGLIHRFVFCFLQTASGKTYTMQGDSNNPGIIQQTLADIFQFIRAVCILWPF